MNEERPKQIGTYAATLSIIELGLGSLLHSINFPFAGHLLSINQTALLSRLAVLSRDKKSVMEVSIVASLLKSLSPSGKKLTPMLAISAQGLLYALCLSVLGINYIGLFIAIVISSLWGFIQPLLILYFLFGKNLLETMNHFLKDFLQYIPQLDKILVASCLLFIIVKIILAVICSFLAIKMNQEDFSKLQNQLVQHHRPLRENNISNPYLGALKDLLNPLFIFSFVLTFIFFYFSQSTYVQLIWALLRPLTLGYALFLLIRIYPMERFVIALRKNGWHQLAQSLEIAFAKIKDDRES